MSWKIMLSTRARCDLRNIYEYIAYRLLAPETANRQVQRIMQKIRTLDQCPMRYRLYEEEPWHGVGLRFFPVGRYLIFYLPHEGRNTVRIVRILYGGRDIRKQLNETRIE